MRPIRLGYTIWQGMTNECAFETRLQQNVNCTEPGVIATQFYHWLMHMNLNFELIPYGFDGKPVIHGSQMQNGTW
jgi:hypothetical protein